MQPKAPLPGCSVTLRSRPGTPKTSNGSAHGSSPRRDIESKFSSTYATAFSSCFDAEDLAVRRRLGKEGNLFQKVPSIRFRRCAPRSPEQSLPGFCPKYLRPVNVGDAYSLAELGRDSSTC